MAKISSPDPCNICLLEKRVSAEEVKDLEIKKLPYTTQVGPKCHHICPYKIEAEGDFTETEQNTHTHTQMHICMHTHNKVIKKQRLRLE